ncbi:MAG: sigma-70 family RNA polymerase sigma factor [Flavobacteriales bacterium]|nr:sigma-70 family RNA polymerase sigma factor [Flavobacteriales bacterium]
MYDPDLNQLIDGCVEGDRKAQEHVYRMFYGKMLAVCMRYTRDVNQAQDLLQDGFIKVFSRIDKFNRTGSFEGWVRRIVVNTAIDHVRRSKNDWLLLGEDQSVEDFAEMEDEEDDQGAEFHFEPGQVMEAMQKLSPAYQAVFNMYVFENMQHNEIAEKLGISVGTSKSNLAKARKNLKKILLTEYQNADE